MSTVLNVKIDPLLKKKAQAVAKDLGLPMSIVVSASLRDFVNTRSITISDSPILKPEVEAELLALSQAARAGRLDELSPAFDSLDEGFRWLDAK
jgi:antitoxin component of RelBE/YafQ-DinJ toxin-antitoxin module